MNNVSCANVSNGSATVSPSIPGAYNYSWQPGGYTTTIVNNLSMGTYTVNATNGFCGSASLIVTIGSNSIASVIPLNSSQINPTCFGLNNGSATVTPTNSMAVTYTWQPGGYNSQSVNNLPAGIYTVNVSNITQPSSLNLNITQPLTICREEVAALSSTLSGGIAPYTYSWSTGSAFSGISVSPPITTNYTLFIIDANGCTNSAVTTVSVAFCTGLFENLTNNNLIIYPNPSSGFIYFNRAVSFDNIIIFNSLGAEVKRYHNFESPLNISDLSNGIYYLIIQKSGQPTYSSKIIKNDEN